MTGFLSADEDDRAEMLRVIVDEAALTHRETGRRTLDPRVMAAMEKVPRERFVPSLYRHQAFANGPLPIGHGQTISQPFMVALMTDLIEPRPGDTVLDVGTGSGYQAAVLAELVEHVYSIEIVAALATEARERLRDLGCTNVTVRHGDGWHGWAEHGLYDGIVVAAAPARIPPALIEQLKPGGRLVIPVDRPYNAQVLKLVTKQADDSVTERDLLLVAFVPLTRAPRPPD